MGTWKKNFTWNVPKVCPTLKRMLHHFKQVHLWPCSGSKAILQKGHQNFEEGIIYVALYIDDNLMVGNMATMDDAIEVLQN